MSYVSRVYEILDNFFENEKEKLFLVSELIVKRIRDGAIIHTFGCGHSSLVAAEVCYRAGGLAALNFLGLLPGSSGWVRSTESESNINRANDIIEKGRIKKNDIVFIISHSGEAPLIKAILERLNDKGALM